MNQLNLLSQIQLILDKFMFMHPILGWSTTSIFAEAVSTAEGGVSGAAGRNVIKILK